MPNRTSALAAAVLGLALTGALPANADGPLRAPAVLAQVGAEIAPETNALAEALNLTDVFAVVAEEGKAYGASLEEEMFPSSGGKSWADAVAAIYAPERTLPAFLAAFDAALNAGGGDVQKMRDFFVSGTGKKAVALEVSARRALLDTAIEDAARLAYQKMRDDRDPRIDLIDAFVEAGDLIEANVSGGLNGSLAFYTALSEGGAFGDSMGEADILSEVWTQEPSIRAESADWLYAMLVMAYDPMTDEELRTYIAFSESPDGRKLNAAMFEAFGVVFTDISRRLGRSAATFIVGSDL